MKKLSLLFLAGMISLGLAAQTDAGNMHVSINSGFDFKSIKMDEDLGGDSETAMSFRAGGGYFIMDNLSLTASLGYSKYGDDDATTSFGFGARYYINGIFPYVQYTIGEAPDPALSLLGALMGFETSDFSAINIGAGYQYMMTDNISLEPALQYSMCKLDGESFSNTFGLKIGFGLYL